MTVRLFQGLIVAVLLAPALHGQIAVNGIGDSITQECFSFSRQGDLNVGSFWTIEQYSFQDTLDVLIQFNLDCMEAGGDGFTFALQNIGPFAGNYAGRLGIGGLFPSVFIEIDIEENSENNDPNYDHVAIMANGSLDHSSEQNLAGPVPAGPSELDEINDCANHTLRVLYLPLQNRLQVFIDCTLKLETTLPNIFPDDMNRFHWGGTTGMGSSSARYEICVDPIDSFGPTVNVDLLCDTSVQLIAPFEADRYAWSPKEFFSDHEVRDPIAFPEHPESYVVIGTDECGFRQSQEYELSSSLRNTYQYDLDTLLCPNETIEIDYGADVLWNTGVSGPIVINSPGHYFLIRDSVCPVTNIDSIYIQGFVEEELDLGPDLLLCEGSQYIIGPYADEFDVEWRDGTTDQFFVPLQSGVVGVQINSRCGTFEDQIMIEFLPCGEVYLPTAFTPGIDMLNDVYKPLSGQGDLMVIDFVIYDRWGSQLFQERNTQVGRLIGWNGQIDEENAIAGEYIYQIVWQLPTGEMKQNHGSFTLIR